MELQLKDRMTVAVMDLEKALETVCYIDKEDYYRVNKHIDRIKVLITEMKWED